MKKLLFLIINLTALALLTNCATCYNCGHPNTHPSSITNNLATAPEQNLLENDLGPYCCNYAKRNYYFAFDSAKVRAEDIPYLKTHGEFLAKRSHIHVVLEGNADKRGKEKYNYHLGLRRA
ncbi:MAG: hypothetical protein JW855_01600, partial [Gammaproteobacteria bacterium]|nr:hypothetical protein [Gammaproteobacteria bacterium]